MVNEGWFPLSQVSVSDEHGRIIPKSDEITFSPVDRRYFCLEQPKIDFTHIYSRLKNFSNKTFNIDLNNFESQAVALRNNIANDEIYSNLLGGVHVPFILPQASQNDIGMEVSEWVGFASASFKDYYPNFKFDNFALDTLKENMVIREGSRWELIWDISKKKDLVGWYFPTALSGFAITDHVKVLRRLEKSNFILSGPLEVSSALVGSPQLLSKTDGKYPNLLALTAIEPKIKEDKKFFWFYEAYGWNLNFNRRSLIGAVSEYYSGGLTLITI